MPPFHVTRILLIRRLNTVRVPHPFPRVLREWVGKNVTSFLPDQYLPLVDPRLATRNASSTTFAARRSLASAVW
jgi:hypothetical protein